MAKIYIDGKDVILFIKRINQVPLPTGGAVFRGLACLESNSFSGTREKKTVSNKCTGGWEDGIAGNGSWSMTGSGQAIKDPLISELNFQELAAIWVAGEVVEIKMANADGTYYRAGTAIITDFSEDANTDDPLSFEATISGLGAPILVKPI